jgi:hypothetical protein
MLCPGSVSTTPTWAQATCSRQTVSPEVPQGPVIPWEVVKLSLCCPWKTSSYPGRSSRVSAVCFHPPFTPPLALGLFVGLPVPGESLWEAERKGHSVQRPYQTQLSMSLEGVCLCPVQSIHRPFFGSPHTNWFTNQSASSPGIGGVMPSVHTRSPDPQATVSEDWAGKEVIN